MDFTALLHSVSYSGSWGQACLPLREFIDRAADLGFDGVMLMAKRPHLSLLDYGPSERSTLRAHLERRGLRSTVVAAYNDFTAGLEHGNAQIEVQIHYITELARMTADLGGSLLRVFTGFENPAAGFTAQWQMVVHAMRECARLAAKFGVTIGVQNHHDIGCGFESQHEFIRAVGEPNCMAMFDAWAPALHGADLAAAAALLGQVTVHTTIANYQKLPRYRYMHALTNYNEEAPWFQAVPVDEGFINYADFLAALDCGGFRGSVAYEICSSIRGGGSIENLDDYARRFLAFAGRVRESGPKATLATSGSAR